ncbi:hypothetical protein HYV86_02030 [Candidatus Woesearchaeota archaeon]|nr:hypothetical protein [Candidatus Woesearchaeota archaeon]
MTQNARKIDLNTIFPRPISSLTNAEIVVPEWSFVPDHWVTALQRGLDAAELTGNVLEVGVGAGTNIIYALATRYVHIETLRGTDVDGRLVDLSVENVGRVLNGHSGKYHPYHGGRDLITGVEDKVDSIFACIPQVPEDPTKPKEADNLAHHFKERSTYCDPRLKAYGLHLNSDLLYDAGNGQGVLKRGGKVILNLAGRPGKDTLVDLFRVNGYVPRILHEEVIPQHRGTSLAGLAVQEEKGLTFEFYGSADAMQSHLIPAREAERRRVAGDPVFHKIYVVGGVRS